MNENEVISILSSGNVTQPVYDWFFRNFHAATLRLSRQFGVPAPDALTMLKEVTGDTIMKIAAGKHAGMTHLRAYVFRALYNQMCNRLRVKSRRPVAELDEAFRQYADMPAEEPDEEKEALIARLYRCVDKLPPGEREPLRLWHLEERSYDEIADLLKIAKNSAKTLVNRAMAKLRLCMSNP